MLFSLSSLFVSAIVLFYLTLNGEMGGAVGTVTCIFSCSVLLIAWSWICRVRAITNLAIMFFSIQVFIGSILLNFGWIKYLRSSIDTFDYDPIVYYSGAVALLKGHVTGVVGINYPGVYYYYGVPYYLFGYAPQVSMVVNFLLATSAVIYAYSYSSRYLAYKIVATLYFVTLLIPDLLWFNSLTSKDGPMASACVLLVFSLAELILIKRPSAASIVAFIVGVSLVGALRTVMLIPIACVFIAMFCGWFRVIDLSRLIKLSALGLISVVGVFVFYRASGAYGFDLVDIQTYDVKTLEDNFFISENSFSRLIYADAVWKIPLLVPFRMALYTFAPLPSIPFFWDGLINGDWADYQGFCAFLTAFIFAPSVIVILAGIYSAWRKRLWVFGVFLIISLVFFAATMSGVQFIHVRYRVASTLLIALTSCLAFYHADRRHVVVSFVVGFFVSLFMGFIYLFFKG